MTNKQLWQATTNAALLSKTRDKKDSIMVEKKVSVEGKPSYHSSKIILIKRYSIDDNGGGYLGL